MALHVELRVEPFGIGPMNQARRFLDCHLFHKKKSEYLKICSWVTSLLCKDFYKLEKQVLDLVARIPQDWCTSFAFIYVEQIKTLMIFLFMRTLEVIRCNHHKIVPFYNCIAFSFTYQMLYSIREHGTDCLVDSNIIDRLTSLENDYFLLTRPRSIHRELAFSSCLEILIWFDLLWN